MTRQPGAWPPAVLGEEGLSLLLQRPLGSRKTFTWSGHGLTKAQTREDSETLLLAGPGPGTLAVPCPAACLCIAAARHRGCRHQPDHVPGLQEEGPTAPSSLPASPTGPSTVVPTPETPREGTVVPPEHHRWKTALLSRAQPAQDVPRVDVTHSDALSGTQAAEGCARLLLTDLVSQGGLEPVLPSSSSHPSDTNFKSWDPLPEGLRPARLRAQMEHAPRARPSAAWLPSVTAHTRP